MSWVDYAGLAFAAIGTLVLVAWAWDRWDRKLQAYIASPTHRADLITRHDCRAAEGYYLTLTRMLNWADRFYGPRLSWTAFNRCMMLAYLYPLFAALIAWVALNQIAPGGLEMFQSVDGLLGRLWRGAVLLLVIAGATAAIPVLFRQNEILDDRLQNWVDSRPHRPGLLAKAGRWGIGRVVAGVVAGVGVFAVAVAVAVVGVVAGVFSVAVVGVGVFAVAVAVAVAVVVAGVGVFAVVVVVAIAVAVVAAGAGAGVGDTEAAALLIFFYLLLPLANAGADWLSLACTRWFLSHMQTTRPSHGRLIGHLAIDLLAGLACLALLLGGLAGLLELWAWLSPTTLPFDWRAYWATSMINPEQGLALWLMCFTTLLPTLVHLVWALTVWRAQKTRATKTAVEMMRALPSDPNEAHRIEISGLVMRGRVQGFVIALAYWMPFMAAALFLIYRWLVS